MKKAIIFDIDGTLANQMHRVHHIEKSPKDWDSFFAEMVDDEVIEPVYFLLYSLLRDFHASKVGVEVIFCTGRPEKYRNITEKWLERELDIYSHRIMMRKNGDYRNDDIVKQEMLDQLKDEGYEIIFAVDDRKRVVDMWRRNGIICLQCAEGNF